MKVIILCAGYATRLYPLTLHQAKPLLEIQGKPIVEHIVNQLVMHPAIFKINVVTNAKFHDDFLNWRNRYGREDFITIINDGSKSEKEQLGSVGDFLFALERDEEWDDTIVIAGDNYFDFHLSNFVLFASLQNRPAIAVYDVLNKELAKHYGIVATNYRGYVTHFEEKPTQPKSTLASIGLYYLPLEYLPLLQEYKRQNRPLDQMGHFIKWLTQETQVITFPVLGPWYDIGDPRILGKLQEKSVVKIKSINSVDKNFC